MSTGVLDSIKSTINVAILSTSSRDVLRELSRYPVRKGNSLSDEYVVMDSEKYLSGIHEQSSIRKIFDAVRKDIGAEISTYEKSMGSLLDVVADFDGGKNIDKKRLYESQLFLAKLYMSLSKLYCSSEYKGWFQKEYSDESRRAL